MRCKNLAIGLVVVWSLSSGAPERPALGQDSAPRDFFKQLANAPAPGPTERNHLEVRKAFRDVVRDVNKATVRVMCQGLHVAFGTIVSPDGYVLTKSSELGGDIHCLLYDGRRLPATLVGASPDHDLAALKVNADRLPAISWAEGNEKPVGSWLITAGVKEYPVAVGVVSTAVRPIARPQAFLGIVMEEHESGVRVIRIMPGSAADRAGFRVGDLITHVAGDSVAGPADVSGRVSQRDPGQQVRLDVLRGPDKLSISATLGNRENAGGEEQAELMDSLGGPLSDRRAGFPAVMQHDTVLRPEHCGGPVVDLSGKVVGINIARASRVASYAIPVSTVRPLLPELISGKYAVARQAPTNQQAAGGE